MSFAYHTPLDPTAQRNFGIDQPAPVAIADRVHHDELDALNHVNNTVYFKWFERLRVRFAEVYGIGLIGDDNSPRTVIRSGEIRYLEEMLMGEDYVVTTRCSALRRTSYSLRQEIWAAGRQRASFDCVMVLLAQDSSERVPIPDDIRTRLLSDGARDELA